MKRLKWIVSTGGPLIIISDTAFKQWSGVYLKDTYSGNVAEESGDFLDPLLTDYGKACSIDNYIGLIKAENDDVLVLGDEPLITTIFSSSDKEALIARWVYGASEAAIEDLLYSFSINSIQDWNLELQIDINSNTQYLIDSSIDGKQIAVTANEDIEYLNLTAGSYKVLTAFIEPNTESRLIIHRIAASN